jgi:hypothetical protein
MLAEFVTEIAVPFAKASHAIQRRPQEWLPGAAVEAQRQESQLLAEVGFEMAHIRVGKKVQVEIISLERSPTKTVLLIRWEAWHGAKLFPVLEGSLELTPTVDNGSRILLRGEYQPPGGAVGRAGDRAVLHHVAAMTARDFVERIASVLSASAAARGNH